MELDPGVWEDGFCVICLSIFFYFSLSRLIYSFLFFTGGATGSKTKLMELDFAVWEDGFGVICLSIFFLFLSISVNLQFLIFFTGGVTGSKTKLLETDSGV